MERNGIDGRFLSRVMQICTILLLTVFFRVGAVVPGTLFIDSFSVPAQSHVAWTSLTADNHQIEFRNGGAFLENSSTSYSGFALHSFSTPLQAFSYSARLSSPDAGVGIFCCTKIIDGTLCGYAVVSGDDELQLLEYDTIGVHRVCSYITRFPHATDNVLMLSGDGRVVSVFCNGFYQFSCPDTFGNPTGIAALVPPQGVLSFDDVMVTDVYTDSLRLPHFSDSLKALPAFFHQLGNGVVDSGDGYLDIRTAPDQYFYAGLDLPIENVVASFMVRFTGDSSAAGAGFFLGKRDSSSEGVAPELRIGLSGRGVFVAEAGEDGTAFSEITPIGGRPALTAGSWHTLQLSREGKTVRCMFDGEMFVSFDRVDSSSFGIGFYTTDSGSVQIRDFVCNGGAENETAITIPVVKGNVFQRQTAIMVDLLGRYTGIDVMTDTRQQHRINGIVVRSGRKTVQLRRQ